MPQRDQTRRTGFTLIELLIVVAIIGLIAAIAIPNLLTAVQRSKQKRTMADMRALGLALEQYSVDYGGYPDEAQGPVTPVSEYLDGDPFPNTPALDGWMHDLWWFPDPASQNAIGFYAYAQVWSFGKDGVQQPFLGGETRYFDCDIVYEMGNFTQAPVGLQKT